MNRQRHQQAKALFFAACKLPDDQVPAFLDRECPDDPELRKEVETLLKHHLPTTIIGDSPDDTSEGKIPRLFPQTGSASDAVPPPSGLGGPPETERFPPGTVFADRYRIVRLLGRGGMGEVYRADDLKLDQPVALKFLTQARSHDARWLQRFHNEVRLARKVTHPNVNRVHDIGEADGETFISMEYVDGQNLDSLLKSIGRLPRDKAVAVARQLCAALGAAHDRGVLHRDLKPANVMIDTDGDVHITDFGIAALTEDTRRGPLVGTPAFMAPELFHGQEPTVQTDLYSLGVVLYEALTGQMPFAVPPDRRSPETAPVRPSSLSADVDPSLERVVLQCLEYDPRRRPDSAHAVAAALPGGDPLAAALAAGQTPSPGMVAAAGPRVGLPPKRAVLCLAAALVGLAVVVLLANRTLLLPQAGLRNPPDVLAHQAEQIISSFGHDAPASGTIRGFAIDRRYLQYVIDTPAKAGRWKHLSTARPPAVFFWYRRGDHRLITPPPFGQNVLRRKLPAEPGMTTVRLDGQGRLLKFSAIPVREGFPSDSRETPPWSAAFLAAGLDRANLEPVSPQCKPPMFASQVRAWRSVYPDNPNVPIRIEAAALGEKIVYFNVVPSYEQPDEPAAGGLFEPTAPLCPFVARFFLLLAAIVGGAILAWRNLRLDRGDTLGARRLALCVLALGLLDWLVGERHSAVWAEELTSCYFGLARATLAAAAAWMWYVAMEPAVRRWWPQTLITWSRLLGGRFRDPLLGRDILVGGMFGIGLVLVLQFDTLLPTWLHLPGPAPRLPAGGYDLAELLGLRYKLGTVISVLLTSITFGLAVLMLMLLLRVALRNTFLAAMTFCVVLSAVFSLDAGIDTFLPWITNAVLAVSIVLVLARVGLVAVIIGRFVSLLILANPITSDFTAWYAPASTFTIVVVGMLLVYGFYVSVKKGDEPST